MLFRSANLYQLKDFSKCVKVYDYENNRDIEISLDETKTLKDNANRFYKLYNKAKTARTKLTELVNESNAKKEYLEQILYSVESAETIRELQEISGEIIEDKSASKSNRTQLEIMKIDLENGDRIYIGRNNRQNDYIVSKLASEDDLWFHVQNCAGSHVLLKSQNVTEDLILQCVKLAKEYSRAKDSAKAGVIYTKRKYLRKPPGAALGYVTYKNEKEIIV